MVHGGKQMEMDNRPSRVARRRSTGSRRRSTVTKVGKLRGIPQNRRLPSSAVIPSGVNDFIERGMIGLGGSPTSG
jgi:hypothetical protein